MWLDSVSFGMERLQVLCHTCHLRNILFIHSISMCKMWWFLAILRSFFYFSLFYTFSCHPSLPTVLPSSVTSSCHLFLGLPLNLVSKFIYNTLLEILLSSVLCTCPNSIIFYSLYMSKFCYLLFSVHVQILLSSVLCTCPNSVFFCSLYMSKFCCLLFSVHVQILLSSVLCTCPNSVILCSLYMSKFCYLLFSVHVQILLSSILCTCPNQRSIVCIIVVFLTVA
jgi:hypothetical protein